MTDNKQKRRGIVFFTLNASYTHTSLSLRCLADAVAGHPEFDCEILYDKRVSDDNLSLCYSPANTSAKIKPSHSVWLTLLERTVSDMRERVLYELYDLKADFYIFSCYIWNIEEMLRHAENLKKLLPDSKIILGGPEISYRSDEFLLKNAYIDYIIRGEGEITLPETICRILSGEEPEKTLIGKLYTDFSSDGTHYERFPPKNGSLVYYETSRGCPYTCGYCVSGIKDHGHCMIECKSVEDSLSGLLEFEQYDSIKIVKLVDRTFNFDRKRAIAIWKALSEDRFTKKYHFEICAELIDNETLDVLRSVPKGKFQFEIGIQSTNPKTLEACGRKTNIIRTLDNTAKMHFPGNITIHADLIAGLPYEDYKSFAKSFNDTYGICDELQLGFLKLLYGTALRSSANTFGCLYMEDPPYTVLKTSDMSFDDIQQLKLIADTLDRYHGSGRFAETINFIVPYAPSPFDFFERLTDYIRKNSETGELRGVSQRKAYELLYEYSCRLLGEKESDIHNLYDAIEKDFCSNETGRLPHGIRRPK